MDISANNHGSQIDLAIAILGRCCPQLLARPLALWSLLFGGSGPKVWLSFAVTRRRTFCKPFHFVFAIALVAASGRAFRPSCSPSCS